MPFNSFDHPLVVLLLSVLVFWLSALLGSQFRKRKADLKESTRADLTFLLGGALTLLGLIIGFTFSMAVSRYDQRTNYEKEEANAIGTEYVRADLLPDVDAAKIRRLLKNYLDQRILHYSVRWPRQVGEIDTQTARLNSELWSAVIASTAARPTTFNALVVSGMNDVMSSQVYAQAALRNRIPPAAWALLFVISIFCNILVGYSAHDRSPRLFLVLPVVLCVTLFFIADMDKPRRGIIHVHPENLETLSVSLGSP